MSTRRSFIRILPLGLASAASLPLLVACGDKAPPPAPPPTPAPASPPAATPMPAPMSEASAPTMGAPAMPDAASAQATAGSTALVSPQDPAAIALGYVAVATNADAGKYTKYAAGQVCGNCALYQGKASDTEGPCPLFGGRLVLSTGWCSAYVKKA